MGITFAKIAANTASVTFTVILEAEDESQSEEEVTVRYYPGRVTEKTIAALQGIDATDETGIMEGFLAFNMTLCSLIKSWDVWDDPAETIMFPIDPVRFAELPIAFRAQVVDAILGDIRPETFAPQKMKTASQNGNSLH